MMEKVTKTDAEWQSQLSPMEYAVTRGKGTERAFTGRYWDHHEHGIYRCVGCGTPAVGGVLVSMSVLWVVHYTIASKDHKKFFAGKFARL